jgi:ribose transport system ATP-binding protein
MKVPDRIYERDEGEIICFGEPVHFRNTREAQEKGICIIHQELNMMNHLTVAQNMFIGREKSRGLFLDERAINEEAIQICPDWVWISIQRKSWVA